MTIAEAKKIIKSECYIADLLNLDRTQMVNTALDTVIEAARDKGKWIILDECANEGVYCSECHKKVFKLEFSPTMKWRNFKYCPNCGARMVESEGKNDK